MTIQLTMEQQAWIEERVASGDYASPEDAVRRLLDSAILKQTSDEMDLAWAKPLVDAALVEAANGETISLEEHRARNATRLAAMKD